MKSIKHILVIPVFNDWRSLNKLLTNINSTFVDQKMVKNEILIINDNSTQKMNINRKKYRAIKKINIITLYKNFGSQKAIAIGLKYLKKRKDKFFITVMDGDGEDGPKNIKKMLSQSLTHNDYIITSNRLKREESWVVVLLYKIHLSITYFFTLKWISFGNFSTFHNKNLVSLLSNNSSWFAHSSSVLKNCKIKRMYSKREKRYYDKSKLGLLSLVEHSLRVNAVFSKNIFFMSVIYILISTFFVPKYLSYIFIILIFTFNISIHFIRFIHWIENLSKINKFIKRNTSIVTS